MFPGGPLVVSLIHGWEKLVLVVERLVAGCQAGHYYFVFVCGVDGWWVRTRMITRRVHDAIYLSSTLKITAFGKKRKKQKKNKQDKEVRRCYTKEKNGTYKAPNISARDARLFPPFLRHPKQPIWPVPAIN